MRNCASATTTAAVTTSTSTNTMSAESKKEKDPLNLRATFRRSRKASRRFSIKNDTETNFTTNDEYFVGPYAHIRKVLDYKYHKHYTKERQWLQDSIIDKLLNEIHQYKSFLSSTRNLFENCCSSDKDYRRENDPFPLLSPIPRKLSEESLDKLHSLPTEPWLIYIAGTEHVSKISAVRHLLENNHFPILSFVLVDPMEIQNLLPEFESYVQEYGTGHCDSLMEKETGYIAEILTRAALQTGTNVLVFTALGNADWYPEYFHLLKKEFHQLNISILHLVESGDDDSDSRQGHQKWFSSCSQFSEKLLNTLSNEGKDQAGKGEVLSYREDEILHRLHELPNAFHPIRYKEQDERITHAVSKLVPRVEYHCLLGISSSYEQQQETVTIKTAGETWESFYTQFKQQPAVQVQDTPQADNITCERGNKNFIHTFDVEKSTEENYKSDDMAFYGPYAHLRKSLDYKYHTNYRRERQMLQDAIISDTLDAPRIIDQFSGQVCTTPTEPFLVFTAGAMGAGKSHTIHYLAENSLFPISAFVLIDPDDIRQKLPEFSLYVDADKFTAGEMTRKEAGYIVEILTLAALQAGKNVLVDTSLRDSQWYKKHFASLRKEYPNVKLVILHIVAPREAVFERAEARGKLTGRVVPRETLEMALEQVPKSVNILKSLVDYYCALNNAPGQTIEILTNGITRESFKQTWVQTCAWIPKVRSKLKLKHSHHSNSM